MKRSLFVLVCLSFLFLVLPFVSPQTQKVYSLNLIYSSNSFELKSLNVIEDTPNLIENTEGYYTLQLISNQKILSNFKFDISNKIFSDEYDPVTKKSKGKIIFIDNVSATLKVPYDENAEQIKILDNENKEIFSSDLPKQEKINIDNNLSGTLDIRYYVIGGILSAIILILAIIFYMIHKRRISNFSQ